MASTTTGIPNSILDHADRTIEQANRKLRDQARRIQELESDVAILRNALVMAKDKYTGAHDSENIIHKALVAVPADPEDLTVKMKAHKETPAVRCKYCETPRDLNDPCDCSGAEAELYHSTLIELKAAMERQGNAACRLHYEKICEVLGEKKKMRCPR